MKKHDEMVIILEGIDGAGKHNVCKQIKHQLCDDPMYTYYTDKNKIKIDTQCVGIHEFPDYNSLCGRIIKNLLSRSSLSIQDKELLASTYALERSIRNELYDNKFVYIFDRYYPSNFCYNLDLDLDWLVGLERDSLRGDFVFILDIDPKLSFERRKERRDNYEKDLDFLNKVRNRYLELASKFGWIVIDGSRTIPEVSNDIITYLRNANNGLIVKNKVI